jgi:hypothetical protein
MNTIAVTEPMIIDHLLPAHDPESGVHVEPYDLVVTQDDFDEEDNWAPGHYAGVWVDPDTGARWDAALVACKAAGHHSRSPEGIAVRYRTMFAAEPPAELLAWAKAQQDEKAEREREQAAKAAREAAELAAFEAILEGFTNIGADDYSAQWWSQNKLAELPLLGEWVDPIPGLPTPFKRAYQLPNGDIMLVTNGVSWSRLTKDQALIADADSRRAIKAHRYEERLFAALAELERAGALRNGCASWFGGTCGLSNPKPAYAGPHNSTGPETVERLRSWLDDCITKHPSHAEALGAAKALATEGSIETMRGLCALGRPPGVHTKSRACVATRC